MSTAVQAATTTYASRVKAGNTPLIIPSAATVARQRSLITGTPLAVAPALQARPSFRSSSRINDDDDDDDFLDVDSEDGKKDKVEEDLIEESGGFVLGPPPEALIQRRPAIQTRHMYRSDSQMESAALAEDVMIPIRLDIDLDSYKIKDAFMWNMNEELVTPDQFAHIMCLDLDIPPQVFASQISSAIRTQIEEYAPVAEIHIPEETEMRVVVGLQLHLAKHLLRDQFEWNLSANDITPEEFSKLLCQDLSLSSDFPPSLAHAIHESLLRLKKDALEGNLPLFMNEAAYGLEAGIRLDTEALCHRWSPTLELLTRDEIERREGDRERQLRRLKRDTARFGGISSIAVVEEEILGSGRRRLKRKRSTSPAGRGTPRGGQASRADSPSLVDVSISKAASLSDGERMRWRCSNCLVPGTGTIAVRRGPNGAKELCNNCGVWYAKFGEVPEWRRRMYAVG